MGDARTSQAAVSVSLYQDHAAYVNEYLVLGLLYDAEYRIRPYILHYTQMYRRFGRRGPDCRPIEWSLIQQPKSADMPQVLTLDPF